MYNVKNTFNSLCWVHTPIIIIIIYCKYNFQFPLLGSTKIVVLEIGRPITFQFPLLGSEYGHLVMAIVGRNFQFPLLGSGSELERDS